MRKSIYTPHYELLRMRLVALREESGLTQRAVGDLLDREHSFVWRVEKGERRLDVVEFFWYVRALGGDPAVLHTELMKEFKRLERLPRKGRKKRG